MQYDVAIIGAGVCGAMIARELSKLDMKIVVLEKCNDISMGTTKANSAIVHAGFDAETGSLKAKLNVQGLWLPVIIMIKAPLPGRSAAMAASDVRNV